MACYTHCKLIPQPSAVWKQRTVCTMPAGALSAFSAGFAAPDGLSKQPGSAQIPVIDGRGFLARERRGAPPPQGVAAAISEAGRTLGAFQLINHGVDTALIERMKASTGLACPAVGGALHHGGRAAGIRHVPRREGGVQQSHASAILVSTAPLKRPHKCTTPPCADCRMQLHTSLRFPRRPS